MTTIVMQRKQLKVTRRQAEKHLTSLIGRGRRLAQLAQSQWEGMNRDVEIASQAMAWREIVRRRLLEIFPDTAEADIMTRGYGAAQSWPARLYAAADRLEDFKESLGEYLNPPVSESLGWWLGQVPAVREWFDRSLWFGGGFVLCKAPEILAWLQRH